MTAASRLVFVPPANIFEAPNSWFSRIALSQGATVGELLAMLRMKARDTDLAFLSQETQEAAMALGIDLSDLKVACRVFDNFLRAGLEPRRFLLYEDQRPSYRFCPHCLKARSEPYFPVHWRFACWRVCPLHRCVMCDSCESCGMRVSLPKSMIHAGPKGEGVAYLSKCLTCSASLSAIKPTPVDSFPGVVLDAWERELASNGRAVLAALYTGVVYVSADGPSRPLRKLAELERRGVIPNNPRFLAAERLIERFETAESMQESS
jgi:hypothetical protein